MPNSYKRNVKDSDLCFAIRELVVLGEVSKEAHL